VKRKWFGLVLLGLGAFLLVIGTLGVVWAPDVVKKTPLDVEQVTALEGTVQKLDGATGELGPVTDVKVRSVTKADSEASDDEVVVWSQDTCVWMDIDDAPECPQTPPGEDADPRIVTVDTDIFASDRYTGMPVNDEKYFEGAVLPEGWLPHDGLVNKWPFDTEKKDYTYWDGTMGQAVPAIYQGEETLLGIDCYVYYIDIEDEPIEVAEGTPGTYDNHIEIWVEPRTGAIQQQTQDQQRYLEDGTQVLDLKIGFTEEQQQQFADDAEGNLFLLDLLTLYVPIIGFVGGGLCIIAGAALLVSSRRREDDDADHNQPEAVSV
jgi:hypothetical protein